MAIDPIARLTRFEQLRRSGEPIGPESLSDGLEGAATPMDSDPMVAAPPAAEEPVDPALAENAWANNPYVVRQKMRRLAKAAGISLSEAQGLVASTGAGVNGDMDARGQATATERAAQFAPLIDAAANARDAAEMERMKRWQSQMMLASSNSRANMSNAFDMLSPEQKQRVIESRLTGGRNYRADDPRMAIAQLEAETRRAEGQDARASAAEIAEANRVAAREEREGVRASEELRYNARSAEEKMKHDALMAQRDGEFKVMLAKMESGDTAAALRSKETLAGIQAQLSSAEQTAKTRADADKYASDQRLKEAEVAAGATEDKLNAVNDRADQALKMSQQRQKEADAVAIAGPGGAHLVQGQYGTPDAQDALDAIAARSDESWLGFTTEDAKRMDAVLIRLGITDPATRKELVTRHGVGVEAPGKRARGSAHSRMWYPHPEYAPVPTAE